MKWIDNIILGLTESFATRNVYELCDCLEIEIRYVEPSNIVLNGHESFFYRNFNDKEIIFVSNKLDYPIKDFVLKHELGHALCHPDLLCAAYSFYSQGKLEKQANYFALKLSDITVDEVELRDMTIDQIASCLEVPESALRQLISI